jgi:hypothetical protein
MRLLQELKRVLNSRDHYQWLGVRHQFSTLYHDRRRGDDALREAHAEFDAPELEEGALIDDADLDLDSVSAQARREAAIQRERARRRHAHSRKTS